MSIELMALIGVVSFITLVFLFLLYRHMPKRLRREAFLKNWRELQSFCRDKKKWPDSLLNADKLLDNALKRRKFKGRTTGERLVSAQRIFTNNDEVWAAHNLTKKIISKPELELRESDVRSALVAFRQALLDLGALPPIQSSNSVPNSEGPKE